MSRVCCALGLVALALVPRAAAAQAPPPSGSRAMVMPFAVDTVGTPQGAADYWLGEAATLLVTDELQILDIDALSRAERVAAFDRLHLPMAATLTRATMIRAAELLGENAIVVGEVRMTDRVRVRAQVIRLDSGQQRPEVTEEGPAGDLFVVFERLARRVAVDVEGRAPAAPREHTHPPLPAFESYVKGLIATTPSTQERFLVAALKSAPAYDQARLALWDVQTAENATAKALATARVVLPTSPLSRFARFDEALSLIELKRYDEARGVLDALSRERASAVLSNAIGVTHLRQGGPASMPGAVSAFTRAVKENPACADCQFNLGYASALSGDSPAGILGLREAVRRDPTDGDAHWVLSALLMTASKGVEAQRELDLAKLLGAPHADATTPLSDRLPKGLERLRTDLDAAASPVDVALAAAAQRDQADEAVFHLDHARRLIASGQDLEGMGELRRAIFLSPYEDEPHVLLGTLDMREGRIPEAIDEFKLALWCRETASTHVALGTALIESGKRDLARAEAQRALAMQPGLETARALLARIGGTGTPATSVVPSGETHV